MKNVSCDFPTLKPVAAVKSYLNAKRPAVYNMVKLMVADPQFHHIVKEMLLLLEKKASDYSYRRSVNDTVNLWSSKNQALIQSWIVKCNNVPGHIGILGKCKKCPVGRSSPMGSNSYYPKKRTIAYTK